MTIPSIGDRRELLSADCANCFGLCCVALGFTRSADFAFDKPAGEPCVNLAEDYRCGIHPVLRDRGFRGCTVFDCQGAGQRVAQSTGVSWRDDPGTRERMFLVFPLMRQLHELLWLIDAALGFAGTGPEIRRLDGLWTRVDTIASGEPESILEADIADVREAVGDSLTAVSASVREGITSGPIPKALRRKLLPAADLLGADLAGLDLRGLSLRGAYLIGADLTGTDLAFVDLLGADLRDADLTGADLSSALFLTQSQVQAARGGPDTGLPATLQRPPHWV